MGKKNKVLVLGAAALIGAVSAQSCAEDFDATFSQTTVTHGSDQTIRFHGQTENTCLFKKYGAYAEGNEIWVKTCDAGNSNKAKGAKYWFSYQPDGMIRVEGSYNEATPEEAYCLKYDNSNKLLKQRVKTKLCRQANEKFFFDIIDGRVHARATDSARVCMGVEDSTFLRGGVPANTGAPLVMSDCYPSQFGAPAVSKDSCLDEGRVEITGMTAVNADQTIRPFGASSTINVQNYQGIGTANTADLCWRKEGAGWVVQQNIYMTICEIGHANKWNRARFMWSYDATTGLIRSEGSVLKADSDDTMNYYLCVAMTTASPSMAGTGSKRIVTQRCDEDSDLQTFDYVNGVFFSRAYPNLCLNYKYKYLVDKSLSGAKPFAPMLIKHCYQSAFGVIEAPEQPTDVPTTVEVVTTAEPTTAEPTTIEPTTAEPTTVEPTTEAPTTAVPDLTAPTTPAQATTTPTLKPTTPLGMLANGIDLNAGCTRSFTQVEWSLASEDYEFYQYANTAAKDYVDYALYMLKNPNEIGYPHRMTTFLQELQKVCSIESWCIGVAHSPEFGSSSYFLMEDESYTNDHVRFITKMRGRPIVKTGASWTIYLDDDVVSVQSVDLTSAALGSDLDVCCTTECAAMDQCTDKRNWIGLGRNGNMGKSWSNGDGTYDYSCKVIIQTGDFEGAGSNEFNFVIKPIKKGVNDNRGIDDPSTWNFIKIASMNPDDPTAAYAPVNARMQQGMRAVLNFAPTFTTTGHVMWDAIEIGTDIGVSEGFDPWFIEEIVQECDDPLLGRITEVFTVKQWVQHASVWVDLETENGWTDDLQSGTISADKTAEYVNCPHCEWDAWFLPTPANPVCEKSACYFAPCQNEGVCSDSGGTDYGDGSNIDARTNGSTDDYTCECPFDYGGPEGNCEKFLHCSSNPCQNGGECSEFSIGNIDTFSCSCPESHQGDLCEYFRPCSANPCNVEGSVEENACTNWPSFNFIDVQNEVYECECKPSHTGQDCQTYMHCSSSPCINEGVCSDFEDYSDYSCECSLWTRTFSYVGKNCETWVPCTETDGVGPCMNGGVCSDITQEGVTVPPNEGSFDHYCNCPESHTGYNCEIEIPCSNEPCQHGGSCTNIHEYTDYACTCLPAYQGVNCQNFLPCVGVEDMCLNGAICEHQIKMVTFDDSVNPTNSWYQHPHDLEAYPSGDVVYRWEIRPDFVDNFGVRSEGDRAVVTEPLYVPFCQCPEHYVGALCEKYIPCDTNPCEVEHAVDHTVEHYGGTCENNLDYSDFICTCPPSHTGKNCEIYIPCSSDPCQNGAECTNLDDYSDYTCGCEALLDETTGLQMWTQKDCQEFIPCSAGPCQNGGSCENFVDNSDYTCTCGADETTSLTSHTGKDCEIFIMCSNGPCQNEYACSDTSEDLEAESYDDYVCACDTTLHAGKNCQIDVVCASQNPCMNSGVCTDLNVVGGAIGVDNADHSTLTFDDQVWDFHCACPAAFAGKSCQITVKCEANPCQQSASCTDVLEMNGETADLATLTTEFQTWDFFCACPSTHTGQACQVHIPCTDNPCDNDSTCADLTWVNPAFAASEFYLGENTWTERFPDNTIQSAEVWDYYCACPETHIGKNCQIYKTCDSSPCQQNATCTETDENGVMEANRIDSTLSVLSEVWDYECACPESHTGKDCQIYVPCSSGPCQQNATCSNIDAELTIVVPNLTLDAEVWDFQCACHEVINEVTGLQTHTDKQCGTFIPCSDAPCQNSGICTDYEDYADYSCECSFDNSTGFTAYTAKNCDVYIPCSPKPCFGDSICFNTAEYENYQCDCRNGFIGTNCACAIDEVYEQNILGQPALLLDQNCTEWYCSYGQAPCVKPTHVGICDKSLTATTAERCSSEGSFVMRSTAQGDYASNSDNVKILRSDVPNTAISLTITQLQIEIGFGCCTHGGDQLIIVVDGEPYGIFCGNSAQPGEQLSRSSKAKSNHYYPNSNKPAKKRFLAGQMRSQIVRPKSAFRSMYTNYQYTDYAEFSEGECHEACENYLVNTNKLRYENGCQDFEIDQNAGIVGRTIVGREIRLILVTDTFNNFGGYEAEWSVIAHEWTEPITTTVMPEQPLTTVITDLGEVCTMDDTLEDSTCANGDEHWFCSYGRFPCVYDTMSSSCQNTVNQYSGNECTGNFVSHESQYAAQTDNVQVFKGAAGFNISLTITKLDVEIGFGCCGHGGDQLLVIVDNEIMGVYCGAYNVLDESVRRKRAMYGDYEYSYYYDISRQECQANCDSVLLGKKVTYDGDSCSDFDVNDKGSIGGVEIIGHEIRLVLISDKFVEKKGYELDWKSFEV